MTTKILPIKAEHALAESVVFFTMSQKAVEYEDCFDHIDFRTFIGQDATIERTKKKSLCEIILKRDDNIVWKFIFVEKCIGFECYDYVNWNNFISIVSNIFSLLNSTVSKDIHCIGLFVKDEFDVIMDVESGKDFALNELFNKKSKYIVPAFFDTRMPPAISMYKYHEHNVKHEDITYCFDDEIKIIADSSDSGLKFFIAHRQDSILTRGKVKIDITNDLLKTVTQKMHSRNIDYVANILEKSILKNIGMV